MLHFTVFSRHLDIPMNKMYLIHVSHFKTEICYKQKLKIKLIPEMIRIKKIDKWCQSDNEDIVPHGTSHQVRKDVSARKVPSLSVTDLLSEQD